LPVRTGTRRRRFFHCRSTHRPVDTLPPVPSFPGLFVLFSGGLLFPGLPSLPGAIRSSNSSTWSSILISRLSFILFHLLFLSSRLLPARPAQIVGMVIARRCFVFSCGNIIHTSLLGCLSVVWTNPSGLLATRPWGAPKSFRSYQPGLCEFKSRGRLLQRSFHKHGPLLIIDSWAKQRGATCWVSGNNFFSMESFPQLASAASRWHPPSHQLQMSLECHSCSSGDFAQKVTPYRQFAFADTQPNTSSVGGECRVRIPHYVCRRLMIVAVESPT